MTTAIARIAPEDVVAMDTEGFYALRRQCVRPASVAEYGLECYAMSANSVLCTHVLSLYQAAVRDDRISTGWGVSTGSGLAAAEPWYVVEIDGRDIYLAPACDGAYEALRKTPCYA